LRRLPRNFYQLDEKMFEVDPIVRTGEG
jgi:hypothetical protein